MSPTHAWRRAALLPFVAAGLALGTACSSSGPAEAPTPTYDPSAPKSWVKATGDLATETCERGENGFAAVVEIRNGDDYDATYIVTATLTGRDGDASRETNESEGVRIDAGEKGGATVEAFGEDAPKGTTCVLTARKQKITE